MSILDWPRSARPRERLIAQGAHALSDAELLAVFLRVGIKGRSAVELGQAILHHFGSLRGVLAATLPAFEAIDGVGPAKFAQLQAALELSRRALAEQLQAGTVLSSPEAARHFFQHWLACYTHECFVVLFLDVKNRMLSCEELFKGTLTQAAVYPREVVKAALKHNAAAILMAHNHPSGTQEPSMADHALTEALKSALALVDVRVLDHFIVAGHHVYSFAEHGHL